MNNLLDFEEFKQKLRLIERQMLDDKLSIRKKVNEGVMTKWKKMKASLFVDRVLKEEIELGKAFEERIKETMERLSKACEELEGKSKKGSEFTKQVNNIIKDINNISFDTLSLIGDQNIDFSGFRNSVIMSNVVQWGALLSPVRNFMMIRKAYHYFLGLIKQTIRKDLVMLIVNFDQFQSVILQKSTEATGNAQKEREIGEMSEKIWGEVQNVITSQLNKTQQDAMLKLMKERREMMKDEQKRDAAYNDYMDAYNNTYKVTAESIKQLLNDDNQKQLEALKTGINKLGTGDEDLTVYGELLISSAEEHALKASNKIHDNFLKMSEVFKLSNQKNLIDLIAEAEKAEIRRIRKENNKNKDKFDIEVKEEQLKFVKSEFKKIKKELDVKLSDITIDDIKKLKDESAEFTYTNDKLSRTPKEEKMTKYKILITYLSLENDESIETLKNCSDDLKMLVDTQENHDNSYYSYMDTLSDSIEKSLVKKDDNCYIDLMVLNSVDDILDVIKKFNLLNYDDETKNKQRRILKYISENVIKIENYDRLLDKFQELSNLNKDIDSRIKENPQDNIKKYFEYLKELNMWNEWDRYERKYELYKEKKGREDGGDIIEPKKPDFDKPSEKPEFKDEHIQLKVEINNDRYEKWKDTFKKMIEKLDISEKSEK